MFTYTIRSESQSVDEVVVMYTWNGGSWTENADGTIEITLTQE